MSLFIIGILLTFGFIFIYNSLISRRNKSRQCFSSIQTYQQKRADLIPNLVNTVKAFMSHEKELLTQLTELRSEINNKNLPEAQQIENTALLSIMTKSLILKAEAYPNLKSSESFLKLQSTLEDIEDQISASRRAYNSAVTIYNTSLEIFPYNLIAKIFSFKQKSLFVSEPIHQENLSIYNEFKKAN